MNVSRKYYRVNPRDICFIRYVFEAHDGLAVISSGLGVVSACWFAMGLLGITMEDITAIWHNIESVMIEEMNQTPPQWPMILT